jgi:GH15 family glucan-1,4-alpha-glucosidase
VAIDNSQEGLQSCPSIVFRKVTKEHMLGEGVSASVFLTEGQGISFVLRADSDSHVTENITSAVVDSHQNDTQSFWFNWLSKSKYKGAWREIVSRSLLILKMLTYEPTGAIVAAPTFSIPEDVGGVR